MDLSDDSIYEFSSTSLVSSSFFRTTFMILRQLIIPYTMSRATINMMNVDIGATILYGYTIIACQKKEPGISSRIRYINVVRMFAVFYYLIYRSHDLTELQKQKLVVSVLFVPAYFKSQFGDSLPFK